MKLINHIAILQPTDIESEEESDDDSEYSEASEDSDESGKNEKQFSKIC